jgi:hypothetical protein
MRTVCSLTVQCAQCAHTDPLITVQCAQCAHLQYSAHKAPTLTHLLQYSEHSALNYSTVHTVRPHWYTYYSTVCTVRSLTVQCAPCSQTHDTIQCAQWPHLQYSAPKLTSQYSAHSAALAPTMSSVFQHILHCSLALLSLFQHAKQRATTFRQLQVPATLLNFKLIPCLPSFRKRALY